MKIFNGYGTLLWCAIIDRKVVNKWSEIIPLNIVGSLK